MKKKLLSLVLSLIMVVSLLPTVSFADDALKGSGTETDPYLLSALYLC